MKGLLGLLCGDWIGWRRNGKMGSELIAIVQVRKHSVITRCGDSSRDREKKWVDLRCVLVA